MFRSKLARVLTKWEKRGGDLGGDLFDLGDCQVTRKSEAKAICRALRSPRLDDPSEREHGGSPLGALLGLFQEVGSAKVYEILALEALPILTGRLRQRMRHADEDEADALLFIVKILVIFGLLRDTEAILEAARLPLLPESYMWSAIFGAADEEYEGWRELYDGLRIPPPDGFLGVAYLDFANTRAEVGPLSDHPFRSDVGITRLEKWLTDDNEEHFSYACSATIALPFLPVEPQTRLLAIAERHPDVDVQVAAAWAAASVGRSDGLDRLREWCLDLRTSQRACSYLELLEREELIPAECEEGDFAAAAEMCGWLAHPHEYGRPPEDIELYDSRELYWPPTDDRRQLWLFRYTYSGGDGQEDPEEMGGGDDAVEETATVRVGMAGSITFELFGEVTADLSPEDVYALHCCWELQMNEDPRAPEERTSQTGRALLAAQNPGFQ